jgi:predicted ATPase
MPTPTLEIRDLGPIAAADLQFGDLTVFTGPHASGKSIALQTLKLRARPNGDRAADGRPGTHVEGL